MKNSSKNIDYLLLFRYLNNEADSSEIEKVKKLLEDELVRKEFEELKVLYNKSGRVVYLEKIDNDAAWENVGQQITSIKKEEHKGSTGRTIVLKRAAQWAALVLILIGISAVFYSKYRTDQKQNLQTYLTNEGERKEVILSDGSRIFLNENSLISINYDFGIKTRELHIKGEAYFEVEKDKTKPFVIHGTKTSVQVLGTTFNVSELKDQTRVTVNSGIVSFFLSNDSDIYVRLTKGEVGEYNGKTNSIVKSTNSDLNYCSWKTGILKFKNTPLGQVLRDLQNHYKIEITLDDQLKNKHRLTSVFDNQPLKEVLEEIKFVIGIDYNVNNKKIVFK